MFRLFCMIFKQSEGDILEPKQPVEDERDGGATSGWNRKGNNRNGSSPRPKFNLFMLDGESQSRFFCCGFASDYVTRSGVWREPYGEGRGRRSSEWQGQSQTIYSGPLGLFPCLGLPIGRAFYTASRANFRLHYTRNAHPSPWIPQALHTNATPHRPQIQLPYSFKWYHF
jgi:hypothetical protein